MCLDKVTYRTSHSKALRAKKWHTKKKKVCISYHFLQFWYMEHNGSRQIPIGKILTVKRGGIQYNGTKDRYPAGFHVYSNSIGLQDWNTINVQMRGLVAKGLQGGKKVEVYAQMKVLSDVWDSKHKEQYGF